MTRESATHTPDGMAMPGRGLWRALVLLIVLRVLAAPIALRYDAPTYLSHGQFVVRRCTWAVPRTASAHAGATRDLSGLRPSAIPAAVIDAEKSKSFRSASGRLPFPPADAVHLSDRPRC